MDGLLVDLHGEPGEGSGAHRWEKHRVVDCEVEGLPAAVADVAERLPP